MTPVIERWDTSGDLAQYGVSCLLHGLLDYLVDGHFKAVEALDQSVEAAADALFDTHDEAHLSWRRRMGEMERVQRRSFELRRRFYGQNVPYPGYGETSGFIVSTVVILVIAVGLYLLFRRKGWL
jgi:Mg2+ and Co2+ transporter CorA